MLMDRAANWHPTLAYPTLLIAYYKPDGSLPSWAVLMLGRHSVGQWPTHWNGQNQLQPRPRRGRQGTSSVRVNGHAETASPLRYSLHLQRRPLKFVQLCTGQESAMGQFKGRPGTHSGSLVPSATTTPRRPQQGAPLRKVSSMFLFLLSRPRRMSDPASKTMTMTMTSSWPRGVIRRLLASKSNRVAYRHQKHTQMHEQEQQEVWRWSTW